MEDQHNVSADLMEVSISSDTLAGVELDDLDWDTAFSSQDSVAHEDTDISELFEQRAREIAETERNYQEQMAVDHRVLDDTDLNHLLNEVDRISYQQHGPINDSTRCSSQSATSRYDDAIPSTSRDQSFFSDPPVSQQDWRVPATARDIRDSVQEGGASEPIEEPFNIDIVKVKNIKKFRATETTYNVKLNNVKGDLWKDHLNTLGNALEACLAQATQNLNGTDRVKIFINQRGLDTPIVIPLKPKQDMTVDYILGTVEKVIQSKTNMKFDESFELNVGTVSIPSGAGRPTYVNRSELRRHKKSIISIDNKDNMCLARAVSVAIAYKFNQNDKQKMARIGSKLQEKNAKDLCLKTGIDPNKSANLEDVKKIEDCLDIQIAVVSSSAYNQIIYKGKDRLCKIYLYHSKDHFDTITNAKAFFSKPYYCEVCDKSSWRKTSHTCDSICNACYRTNCFNTSPRKCHDCNRRFRNKNCFDRHLEPQIDGLGKASKSMCEQFWQCNECVTIINTSRRDFQDHICGEFHCRYCDKYYIGGNHVCYIKPKAAEKPSHNYIYFDFESTQENSEHIPNFVCAQQTCVECIDKEIVTGDETCTSCGPREVIFQGPETVNDFCFWLFSKKHKNYTAIAHNAKGYDAVFLLNYLLENGIKPNVAFNGTKIMFLEVHELKFKVIDSLNHISTSLANFPKTFGLPELRKGYFPHFFNTTENQNYTGPFPAPHFYGHNTMSKSARCEFLEWHKAQHGKIFDFRKEMLAYCRSDVDILRRSCLKFRKTIIEITTPEATAIDEVEPWGVDPWQYVTIASLCFGIFRHLFLKDREIVRVPATGVVSRDQYSKISIQWLEAVQEKARLDGKIINIKHALNGGEHRIGAYRLDGYHSESNTIFEFLGCWHHGCTLCEDPEKTNPKYGVSNQVLYSKVLEKQSYFEERGYEYVMKWEHEFLEDLKTDKELKTFVDSLDIQTRLDPKEAFFGGRTNAFKLHCKAAENEKIRYLDVCSLYPYINKYRSVPIGSPEIITDNFGDISQYYGFVKAKVLPPRNLYFPILPFRTDKLNFPLCRTCCIKQLPNCNHSDQERCLTGTWITPELQLAVSKGYTIERIYEVYHFPNVALYDGFDPSTGLLAEYVNTFLRLKTQASFYPGWCKSEADKQKYIQDYFEKEGIRLEAASIEKNPGLRSIAKSLLNNIWGKFGQRNDMSQTTFVTAAEEFFSMIVDDNVTVKNFHLFSEDIAFVEWSYKDMAIRTGPSSNVWIAAFTTGWGRIELYKYLDKVGGRALYCDTDSIIFRSRPGEEDPPLGDNLGDLTDELKEGEHILEYISGGPKNYALALSSQREIVKVRGFSLNYANSMKINFDTVASMVKYYVERQCSCTTGCAECEALQKVSLVNKNKIYRDKYQQKVLNKVEKKTTVFATRSELFCLIMTQCPTVIDVLRPL